MDDSVLQVDEGGDTFISTTILKYGFPMHSDGFKNHQFLLVATFVILNFISLFYFNNFVWSPDINYYELYNAETF